MVTRVVYAVRDGEKSKSRFRPRWLVQILALALAGCSSISSQHPFQMPGIGAERAQGQTWPVAPEVPRYAFIGHLYGESNTRAEAVNWSGLARFLAVIVGLDARSRDRLDLVRPQQVATDGKGRIYVTDPGMQSIFVFDETLGEFTVWNEQRLDLSLPSPIGIVYAEDSVWITDSELALVYRLSPDGEVLASFGQGILRRPTGIAFDPDGRRLFVSDTAAGQIVLFDPGGALLDVWGDPGQGAGHFNRPTYITYRPGRLYVADSLNARIQMFDDEGRYAGSFGRRGLYVGNFSRPKGVALDSDGNIYVTESYFDHVLIYNREGEFLMSIGGSGVAPGRFSQPTGLWVDDQDRVFVSDMLNSRVSMFQYLGSN